MLSMKIGMAVGRRLVLCAMAAYLCVQANAAFAESTYPSKPIRLIVPFPPGGGGDRLGRLLAEPLGKALNTNVVVENQGGANGNIALQTVARADPDGHVLGLTLVDHIAVNPLIYNNLPYDSLQDFKAVGLILSTPYVIAVAEQGPATLTDLIANAKARSGEVSIGYPTVNIQMAMLDLQQQAKAAFNLIPYRGFAQGMPDMLGGRLTAWVGTSVTMRGFVEGGKVRGLAITSAERTPVLPNVPTVAESGYPGYEHVTWYGIIAPAHTPDAIIEKINRSLNDVLRLPKVKSEIERDGATVIGGAPEVLTQALKTDIDRLRPMIKAAGISAQ